MGGHRQRHREGSRRQGRSVLCISVGCVHHLARGWNKQKALNARQQGRHEHREVLHLLPHEKVDRRLKKNESLHHKRNEGPR